MRRLRAAGLLALGAALTATLAAAPAQAAPGDTMTLCGSVRTPAGWVDVNWGNSGSCGVTTSPNIKMVKQLTGLPVGTTVNACATTYPPAGWVQVSSYYNSGCQAFINPSFNPNAWTLKRVS
ncbi:hypothetical protein ACIHFE_29580 [Streptomyces sp. NPDC052396]|uniref:hypothetical protein n=1 Tax=Streptomyces sp. NPDC052396 TaxID=3365689 RepID=UPI0037D400C1